jgi:6-pyruvoyl-tetrahydropterin synthase
MTMDASELDGFLAALHRQFDNRTIVGEPDLELYKFLMETGPTGIALVNGNPTSEVIAKHIFNWAYDWFGGDPNIKVVSVTIGETCGPACTYSNPDIYNSNPVFEKE